jgi:hypothetical protein
VDELEVRRLPAEARTVVDHLQVDFFTGMLDERHRPRASGLYAYWKLGRPSKRAGAYGLAAGLALLVGAACGGTEPTARDPHGPFRAIQRDEAVIERSLAAHASAATECEARCAAPGQACEASQRICRTAEPLGDADATARCRDAQRSCGALRAAGDPTGCTCTRARAQR